MSFDYGTSENSHVLLTCHEVCPPLGYTALIMEGSAFISQPLYPLKFSHLSRLRQKGTTSCCLFWDVKLRPDLHANLPSWSQEIRKKFLNFVQPCIGI